MPDRPHFILSRHLLATLFFHHARPTSQVTTHKFCRCWDLFSRIKIHFPAFPLGSFSPHGIRNRFTLPNLALYLHNCSKRLFVSGHLKWLLLLGCSTALELSGVCASCLTLKTVCRYHSFDHPQFRAYSKSTMKSISSILSFIILICIDVSVTFTLLFDRHQDWPSHIVQLGPHIQNCDSKHLKIVSKNQNHKLIFVQDYHQIQTSLLFVSWFCCVIWPLFSLAMLDVSKAVRFCSPFQIRNILGQFSCVLFCWKMRSRIL